MASARLIKMAHMAFLALMGVRVIKAALVGRESGVAMRAPSSTLSPPPPEHITLGLTVGMEDKVVKAAPAAPAAPAQKVGKAVTVLTARAPKGVPVMAAPAAPAGEVVEAVKGERAVPAVPAEMEKTLP